ncbi:MAG: UDP-N-acetylglucosamine 2-epimerase (non-hydrolyzing) [candidate division Zixibacteria bacterium]
MSGLQQRLKTLIVVGTRPDFMKAAPIIERMKRFDDFIDPMLLHTGQHYDSNLSGLFFDELGLRKPDVFLGVGSGTHAEQTARILTEFEKSLAESKPHLVIVIGNTNSAVAAAMVAAKGKVLVAHVESGLRSFDTSQPEEINRLIIDKISDCHFVTESTGSHNLLNEGVDEECVFFVGNVLIDTLLNLNKIATSRPLSRQFDLGKGRYGLLTLHKPENVDNPKALKNILTGVSGVTDKIPVLFPCHPRTRNNIDKFNLTSYFGESGIRLVEPVGALDFLKLETEATMVFTDSGGIQEETTILNIPCLTLRKSTDRQVTLHEGTNILVGPYAEKITAAAENILNGAVKTGSTPKYWDGKAAERIVDTVMNIRQSLFEPESVKKGTAKLKTVREALVAEK